jgi:hypothetical protein
MKFLPVLSYKLLPILFALAFVQGGPASDAKSAIRGAVMTRGPDNEPIFLPGVRILLRCEKAADNEQATLTDEDGRFALSDLTPGKCSVTASAEGFRSETKIAAPTEGSVVELSFRLELLTVGERRDKP